MNTVKYTGLSVFLFMSCCLYSKGVEPLRRQLNKVITPFKAIVGVSVVHLERGETLTVNSNYRYPMQSVYKFPLAMAVLNKVDKGILSLEQKVHISKDEVSQNTWSPMAKLYPEGNIDLTIAELLEYTVSKSDNITCDVLFKLMGGTQKVEQYIHQLGYSGISIKATEAEMHIGLDAVAKTNGCYPTEMTRLLVDFYNGKHLTKHSSDMLMRLMTESSNSDARIKGLLPASVRVAHKTGTGNKVVNDVGIITLPNGNHVALAVFIEQSQEEFKDTEKLIAKLSKSVFTYFNTKPIQSSWIPKDSLLYILDSAYTASPFFANILLTQQGKTIFERSYGYADAVNQKRLTSEHSFQVASISKQFTAYGIMLLKSKGKLEYDHPVSSYLPGFPYSSITIRHLLQHTSGLPDFWDGIRLKMDTLHSFGNKEVLQYLIANKPPLQSEPGSVFSYCDIGYDFLANIIENISGLSYDVFMSLSIFVPLGMTHTVAYKVTDIQRIQDKHLAIGHVYRNGKFEYAHLQPDYHFVFYLGDFYGDGSVVTTTHDLAKWDEGLNGCKLLPCNIQQEAFEPARKGDSIVYTRKGWSYGFGWFVNVGVSPRMVYHTGAHPGNVHGIYRLKDKRTTFIFLSNSETPSIRKVRSRILQLIERE